MIAWLFLAFWAIVYTTLELYRPAERTAWNLFDGAVVALVITTALVEYQWWYGLGRTILEYVNA